MLLTQDLIPSLINIMDYKKKKKERKKSKEKKFYQPPRRTIENHVERTCQT